MARPCAPRPAATTTVRIEDWNVRDLGGRTARLEIVDAESGGWGSVGVDEIVFCDEPRGTDMSVEQLRDGGSTAIALFDSSARFNIAGSTMETQKLLLEGIEERSSTWWDYGANWPGSGDGAWASSMPSGVVSSARSTPGDLGVLGRDVSLAPGESRTLTFRPRLALAARRRRARVPAQRARFAQPLRVALAARNRGRESRRLELRALGRRDTSMARHVVSRFDAAALVPRAHLHPALHARHRDLLAFPRRSAFLGLGRSVLVPWHLHACLELRARPGAHLPGTRDRDQRERVDFGLAFHDDSGAIDYRGEAAREVAVDGQAGTILRAYGKDAVARTRSSRCALGRASRRRHLMLRDERLDGILDGPQYNTLDTAWHGCRLAQRCVRRRVARGRGAGDGAR